MQCDTAHFLHWFHQMISILSDYGVKKGEAIKWQNAVFVNWWTTNIAITNPLLNSILILGNGSWWNVMEIVKALKLYELEPQGRLWFSVTSQSWNFCHSGTCLLMLRTFYFAGPCCVSLSTVPGFGGGPDFVYHHFCFGETIFIVFLKASSPRTFQWTHLTAWKTFYLTEEFPHLHLFLVTTFTVPPTVTCVKPTDQIRWIQIKLQQH